MYSQPAPSVWASRRTHSRKRRCARDTVQKVRCMLVPKQRIVRYTQQRLQIHGTKRLKARASCAQVWKLASSLACQTRPQSLTTCKRDNKQTRLQCFQWRCPSLGRRATPNGLKPVWAFPRQPLRYRSIDRRLPLKRACALEILPRKSVSVTTSPRHSSRVATALTWRNGRMPEGPSHQHEEPNTRQNGPPQLTRTALPRPAQCNQAVRIAVYRHSASGGIYAAWS